MLLAGPTLHPFTNAYRDERVKIKTVSVTVMFWSKAHKATVALAEKSNCRRNVARGTRHPLPAT